MKKVLENKRYIFILSAPALILLAAFVIYPLINIIIMSLQETNGLSPAKFVGFQNFLRLFQDASFLKANIWSIGLCLLAVLCNAILAIAVSILLCTLNPRMQKILRTALILPLVLSISVIAQLWLAIYHADWGLLNSLLEAVGLGFLQNNWLSNSQTAMICIAIVGMWWSFGLDLLFLTPGSSQFPKAILKQHSLTALPSQRLSAILRFLCLEM